MRGLIVLGLLLMLLSFTTNETISTRFSAPKGYKRIKAPAGSFSAWLQTRPLKPRGTKTLTYKGSVARTDDYTAAVIDMSIGQYDLQQCADAVIRLKAEYLFGRKDYKAIHFNFTSGFNCDFIHYADGYRYQPNETWKKTAVKDYSYASFLRYLDLVFSYAGTLSLEKELIKVDNPGQIQVGDVFIKGGSPGHCFIVMNVSINPAGQRKFMLAQSFIPAQNIQLLQYGSPWFSLDKPVYLPYGEIVNAGNLKRFNP
jgi:hypothetical protein